MNMQTGWKKAHRASILHKELKPTEERWKRKKWCVFQGKNIATVCLMPNGQPENTHTHTHIIIWTEQVIWLY